MTYEVDLLRSDGERELVRIGLQVCPREGEHLFIGSRRFRVCQVQHWTGAQAVRLICQQVS